MERLCDNCGKPYNADNRNIKRGWGLTCSKSCAAKKREKNKNIPYNLDENKCGVFRNRYSSEGYKLYENGDGDCAVNDYGEEVYTIKNWEHEHPFSEDAF